MSDVFQWNAGKADANFRKHQVRFEEATTVFRDPLARIFEDTLHSTGERREIIIGTSETNRLLMVCFTEVSEGAVRIISARAATRMERMDYEENPGI